jgi:hydroxymethylglutaryl-CoA reductase (NADPH)
MTPDFAELADISVGIEAVAPTQKTVLKAEDLAFGRRERTASKLSQDEKIPKFGAADYSEENVTKRLKWIEEKTGKEYPHISGEPVPFESWKGNIENLIGTIQVPVASVGPILIDGQNAKGKFYVPFATTEGAITTVYHTGMRIVSESGGVRVASWDNGLHITPAFKTNSIAASGQLKFWIESNFYRIKAVAESTTMHGKLLEIEVTVAERMTLTKFLYSTADAQGMNMINVATLAACEFIEANTKIEFVERSNYSAVKKVSAHIQSGSFGKAVFAEATIPSRQLSKLRVSAAEMATLWHRGYLASMRAGMMGINCQVANGLAGIFLACGQDMADLVSSHIATSNCESMENGDLYISLHMPSVMVGTVGGGTGIGTQRECLEIMGCYGSGKVLKFLEIIAATALAGELVTGAALVTRKFVQGHALLGRNKPIF